MGLIGIAGSLIGGLTSLRDAIGVIRDAVRLPAEQRELAGTRLHEAIAEIAKSFEAIEAQLVALLGADVLSTDGRSVLVELEGDSARVHLANMRGHCSTIGEIWETDLKTVFQRLTSGTQFAQLELAFTQLDSMDGIILKASEILANGIADEAAAVLDFVDSGLAHDAHARLREIRREVRELRRLVNGTLAEMVELRFVLRKQA